MNEDLYQLTGETAGQVWHYLDAHREPITVAHLATELGLSPVLTAMAVGWLAREDKVILSQNEGGLIEVANRDFSFGRVPAGPWT